MHSKDQLFTTFSAGHQSFVVSNGKYQDFPYSENDKVRLSFGKIYES